MSTIFGRAPSAYCLLGDHRHCIGPDTYFLHHREGQGRSRTNFKAKCNCPCHQQRGNVPEKNLDLLLRTWSAYQAQADKPPATREKAKEE